MKTKIEEAKNLKCQLENSKERVEYCLGKKRLEDGTFVSDPRKDKHDFKFSTIQHHYSLKPIYLDAYYGYFGNNNVFIFNDEFYIQCMAESINKFLVQLREETEKIMEQKYNDALLEVKGEVEEILRTFKGLELN